MNCTTVQELLSEFIDGGLSADIRHDVEVHLHSCVTCRKEFEAFISVRTTISDASKEITPKHDLWNSIADRITEPKKSKAWWTLGLQHRTNHSSEMGTVIHSKIFNWKKPHHIGSAIALALIFVFVISFWVARQNSLSEWSVSKISGMPQVGSSMLADHGMMGIGESLITDPASRARIRLGVIGYVDVEPNSRVRLLNTDRNDHRLALDHGAIRASVSAPPRIFSVETPSVTAVDLGCEYRLMVDETGRTVLLVTAGYVALEWNGSESIVPAGSECDTRSGIGPGIPYSEHASPVFRRVLGRFDFEQGGETSVDTILSIAQKQDAVTLWHLLSRVDNDARGKVYDCLSLLVPPPKGVTKDGIAQLDPHMLNQWWEEFEPMTLPATRAKPSLLEKFWNSVREVLSL